MIGLHELLPSDWFAIMSRMDKTERPPIEEQADTLDDRGSGKRGFLLALIALIAVLSIGFVAYNMLSSNHGSPSPQTPDATNSAASGDSASSTSPDSSSKGANAQVAPKLADYDATVFTEYGDARTLTQLADGKPFVMNFWATWCPFCVQEMGDFQKLFDEYDGRVSFAFIDAADGKREKVEDAATWLIDNGYALPAYYDTKLEASYAFGASVLPTTVVVNADGEIVTIDAGRIDLDRMRSLLDSLL